jgi:glucose-6-phosphate 1-dehydrogenase
LSISVGARIKKQGEAMTSMPVELSFVEKSDDDNEAEAYEQLLSSAIRGDTSLFVREDAVEAQWAVVQNLLHDPRPVHIYEPGTWGPVEAERLATDVGGWHEPQSA